jgi:hypothetical protein
MSPPVPVRDQPQTQVLPVAEPTRQLPPLPWADAAPTGPAVPLPPPAYGSATPPSPVAAPSRAADADPLLAQIGAALFWVTVGWWVIVIVRVLGSLVRLGSSPTLLIENIDRWPEETIVVAVISVLAAVVLLLGRGSRGRDALGWAAALLAVVTVGVTIWRLLP